LSKKSKSRQRSLSIVRKKAGFVSKEYQGKSHKIRAAREKGKERFGVMPLKTTQNMI